MKNNLNNAFFENDWIQSSIATAFFFRKSTGRSPKYSKHTSAKKKSEPPIDENNDLVPTSKEKKQGTSGLNSTRN